MADFASMQLSVECLEDLNAALTTQLGSQVHIFGPGSHAANTMSIRIAPLSRHGKPETASIRTLSAAGVELLLSNAIKTGEKFVAEFPSRRQRVMNLLCVVNESVPEGKLTLHRCGFICAIAAEKASDAAEIHRISASMFDW